MAAPQEMEEPPKDLREEAKQTELDGPTNLGHVQGPGLSPGLAWGFRLRLTRKGHLNALAPPML